MTALKYLWIVQLLLLSAALYLFWRNRAMKKRQDALAKDLKGKRYWRINLARPAFYRSWMRIMPFEAKGVLIDDGERLTIKGLWLKDHRAFESSFDKANATVQWLGNCHLRAGNLHWAQLSTPRGEMLFCADTGIYALPSREALSDIFRSVFPDYTLGDQQTSDFALDKNPASVGVTVLFLALLLFSLIDTFVVSRFELVDAQIWHILTHPLTWVGAVGGGIALLVLTYRQLLGRGVPARESMVLGMFVTCAMIGAAMPLAKRTDQWLARLPTQSHAYRVTTLAHLEPVDTSMGLPNMRFPRAREFWAQYPQGSYYLIPFLRGPLGLWQLDHAAFDPPLIDFYENH